MHALMCSGVGLHYPAVLIPTFKEWVVRHLARGGARDYLWALRGVSFELEEGGSLGIIGPNGAGKSSLLRIIAGILTPSEGVAETRGRVAPLIELGTGFDHELSGRENIFFNGALLGRSRVSMRRNMDAIVEFSGLEEFIDGPLRTYSTGMIARLAFSIATSVDADIILLDEILSVGDAAFQKKCQERIESFYKSGATVILVSHDLASIQALCREVLWIEHGSVRGSGAATDVIAAYQRAVAQEG